MVASDTVVGLVGAGVLLVALVGVFVYESQQGTGGSAALSTVSYLGNATATVTYTPQVGTYQMVGTQEVCVPPAPPPPVTQCTRQRTTVDAAVSGLPDPRGMAYVAWVVDNNNYRLIGKMSPSAAEYKASATFANADHRNKDVAISLEKAASPAGPGWIILTLKPPPLKAEGSAVNFGISGNHTLTFTPSGSDTAVKATLEGVKNTTGFAYRGWMVKVDPDNAKNVTFTFVGNFTYASGSTTNGAIDGTVAGVKGDYSKFIVTLEDADKFDAAAPKGPTVVKAAYNMPVGST